MQEMNFEEIQRATGGVLMNASEGKVNAVSTDTRKITENCLFIALKGERFDGNDFAGKALEAGAALAMVSRKADYSGPVLLVEDTRLAFGKLAAAYRNRFSPIVVGVTGSVGKTSTKEMIYTVLSHHFCTMKTEGNFNNDIGLPHTLFRMEPEHQAAVIEMGMSALGEISYLTKLARPTIGVITNIGVSHLENLKTRDNILKAKLEILDGMSEDAPLFLNADNDKLQEAIPRLGKRVRTFALEHQADFTATDLVQKENSVAFVIHSKDGSFPAEIPVLGIHNVYNALAAFGIGLEVGMTPEEITASFADYQNSGLRQKLMESGGIRIMADCYNASPDSMRSSLSVMGSIACPGRRYAVLGDMLELGDETRMLHYKVGKMTAECGIDEVFCFGTLAEEICQGAADAGVSAHYYENLDDLIDALKKTLKPGDAVGFKASRGMRLERAIAGTFPDTVSES